MPAEERLEYAIRRLNWRRAHRGVTRMPGFAPIGALPTLEEAEADRARREAEVRVRVANPFLCGLTHPARSRLPEPIFCDWLRDVGIEPPPVNILFQRDWPHWWDAVRPALSAEQIAHVWAGLDRVRFFEVAERPEGCIGYAVVSIEWTESAHGNWMDPGGEGGVPLKVFRRWADAQAFRHETEELTQHLRAPDPYDHNPPRFDITRWANEPFWPLGPPLRGNGSREENTTFAYGAAAPFYEIVEIDRPDAENDVDNPWQVFVVARIAWTVEGRGGEYTAFAPDRTDTPYGEERRFVPVAAFGARGAAELRMRELELEAARLFNPFWSAVRGPTDVVIARLAAIVPLPEALPASEVRRRPWTAWWDDNVPTWPDETLARVWELLDRIRFYEVLELDLR